MTYSVSITFLSMPSSAPKFTFKELQLRKGVPATVSNQATVRPATDLLASCDLRIDRFSVNQSCCRYLATPLDHFGELVSPCMNVSPCTRIKITGYWVGPDFDDGCGFVEAFVNRIT